MSISLKCFDKMSGLQLFFDKQKSGGYGLLSRLLQQTGNGGTDLKLRLNYQGVIAGGFYEGVYNPATTYTAGDRVSLNSSAYLWYEAKTNLTGGAHANAPSAYGDNDSWKMLIGAEVTQNVGGELIRYTLGFNQDDLIRWGTIQRGTLGTSSLIIDYRNYETTSSLNLTTSSTSNSNPTAAGQTRTWTVDTGLNIAPSTLQSGYSESFAMPAVNDVLTKTIATGLSISEGDTLSWYGNASNMFVFVVMTYNSGTGSIKGFVTAVVGSGTFASWDIKKEAFLFGFHTGFPVDINHHAVVQAYDSGTGVMQVFCTSRVGSGTLATWTFRYGKRPGPVTSSQSSSFNLGSQNLGCWYFGEVNGTYIVHSSSKGTGGTGWKYIMLSGPNAGDEATIDTYNASFLTGQTSTVFNNLEKGTHRFIAFSVTSPSGSSTNANAWVNARLITSGPFQSFIVGANIDTFTPNIPFCGGGDSSGEKAWTFKEDGTGSSLYWDPDHNFDRVNFQVNPPVYIVDGVTIDPSDFDENEWSYKFQSITSFRLEQTVEVIHPTDGKVADKTYIHEITKNGLYYKEVYTPVVDVLIGAGYVNMMAYPESGGNMWFNGFTTDLGGAFTWPGGVTPQNLSGTQIGWQSALFNGTTDYAEGDQYLGAMWIKDPVAAWRVGLSGKGQDTVGYSAGAKLYPRPFDNYVLTSGTVYTIEARIYFGLKGTL